MRLKIFATAGFVGKLVFLELYKCIGLCLNVLYKKSYLFNSNLKTVRYVDNVRRLKFFNLVISIRLNFLQYIYLITLENLVRGSSKKKIRLNMTNLSCKSSTVSNVGIKSFPVLFSFFSLPIPLKWII